MTSLTTLLAEAGRAERERYVVTTEGGVPGCKIVEAERGSNPEPLWTFPKVAEAYRHIDLLVVRAMLRALSEAGMEIIRNVRPVDGSASAVEGYPMIPAALGDE